MQYKNPDGGFGAHGRSTLISTYHAVAGLEAMGYDVASIRDVERFVRMCEKPDGGFTSVPELSLPYMQDVYSGIRILRYLGKNPRNPRGTVGLILGSRTPTAGSADQSTWGSPRLRIPSMPLTGLCASAPSSFSV